jgi:predicted permease
MYFTIVHVTGRPNFVMFGLALMYNMFGDEGVRIASMLTPVAVIPFNFIGVILISLAAADPGLSMPKLLKETALNCIKNPIIICAIAGLATSISGLRMPPFLLSFIDPLSKVGNPLALLLLGAQIDLRSLKDSAASVVVISIAKLVLIPAAAVAAAVSLGFRGMELAVLLIYFAAPIGVACTVLAQHYDVCVKFTAQVVTVTSILSGFTMFLWISIMKYLQLL